MRGKGGLYLMIGDQHRLGGKVQGDVPPGIPLDQPLELFLAESSQPFGLERNHKLCRREPRAHRHCRQNINSRSASRQCFKRPSRRITGRLEDAYSESKTSPKSVPKAPLDLLIPASYNLLPKGKRCNTRNGNNNMNCDTLINTQPRLNTMPKASPFKNCAQVLRGLSDIGRVCKAAKSTKDGDMGEGLSTWTVIRYVLVCVEWRYGVVIVCGVVEEWLVLGYVDDGVTFRTRRRSHSLSGNAPGSIYRALAIFGIARA